MRTALLLTMSIVLAPASVADETGVVSSKTMGISIEPPVTKQSQTSAYQVAMLSMPVSEGFAANVNIQKQRFSQSMEVYDQVSRKQFAQMNGKILQSKRKGNEVIYECKAQMQGKNLHFYVRAVKEGNFVYGVTATALESQWKGQKTELMKSVNSFKLTSRDSSQAAGLSIELPVTKKTPTSTYQLATLFLPASEGFAANVNIQKQVFPQSMEVYDQVSQKQYAQLKAKMLHSKRKDNEVIYECQTQMRGKTLRFYQRAIKSGAFVYLVTATGLESQWNEQKAGLLKSVNSFKLTK